jgi:pimeloyl-ACP methyl ester carboxylesterase
VLCEAITTPDGRTLAIEQAGDPAGRPVLIHMGTPNSRHIYEPVAQDAAVRGLRLICYDRPGYGGSTPQPGRTVAACALDVRAICAELELERIAVWGISGGGPHAIACAVLLPDLVAAVAALASIAPYGAEGLDFFSGMGSENVEDVELMLRDEPAARAKLEKDREELLGASAADLKEALATLLTPTDAAVLDGPLAEYLVSADHDGLAPGAEGWWEDGVAHLSPWGFALEETEVPVLVMHGQHDMFVPRSHGEWLAAHIPGAQARMLDDDGHLTLLVDRIGEVHEWLAEHL